MSGAWNEIGWSAQKPATYTDAADGQPGTWRLPNDVPTVVVHGAYHDIDGGLAHGYILFEANSALTHVASKSTILQPQFYVTIPRDGTFEVTLPATDSLALLADVAPFTYTVSVVLGRKLVRSFKCALPKATASVDIKDLVALP